MNSFYSLPLHLTKEDTFGSHLSQEVNHRLPTDLHGILLTENEYLTTKLKFRLSFLRAHHFTPSLIESSLATTSTVESNAIQEGPCGVYLASGILREVDRISHSLPESIKHHPSVEEGEEISSIKCLYTCYLEGTLDHIAQDIPDNFFQVGEKITCHVAIYSSSLPPTNPQRSEPLSSVEEEVEFLPSVSVLSHLSTSAEVIDDNEIADTNSTIALNPPRRKSSSTTHTQGSSSDIIGGEIVHVLTNQLNEKQRIIEKLLDDGALKAEVFIIINYPLFSS